eukprot:g5247.t1
MRLRHVLRRRARAPRFAQAEREQGLPRPVATARRAFASTIPDDARSCPDADAASCSVESPHLLRVNQAPGADSKTELHWSDGHLSTFHNSWLRDHCQCPECLDPATMQRSFDSLELDPSTASLSLPPESSPNEDGVTVRGSSRTNTLKTASDTLGAASTVLELEMKTDDDKYKHNLKFSVQWLRENCYSSDARSERAMAVAATRKDDAASWDPEGLSAMAMSCGDACPRGVNFSDTGGPIPSTCFDELDQDPLRLRRQLQRYGIAFIADPDTKSLHDASMSTDGDWYNQLVDHTVRSYVGFPRETLWGTFWDTAVVETEDGDQPRDTAYTNVALRNHVDCTYLRDPPQLQVFLCAAEAEGATGGESTFQDGFRVADEMFKISPEAFWFFATTKLGFQCTHDGVGTLSYAPVFELDPAFETHFVEGGKVRNEHTRPPLQRFRYNNDDRAVINHLSAESVDEFYRHLPLLLSLLRREDLTLRKRLSKGDWVIVNNHRVLHGRTAFSGTGRKFVGCYAEMAEASFIL